MTIPLPHGSLPYPAATALQAPTAPNNSKTACPCPKAGTGRETDSCGFPLFSPGKKELRFFPCAICTNKVGSSPLVHFSLKMPSMLCTDQHTPATGYAKIRIDLTGIQLRYRTGWTQAGTSPAIGAVCSRHRTKRHSLVRTIGIPVTRYLHRQQCVGRNLQQRFTGLRKILHTLSVCGIRTSGSHCRENAVPPDKSCGCQGTESVGFHHTGQFQQRIIILPVAIDHQRNGPRFPAVELAYPLCRHLWYSAAIHRHANDQQFICRNLHGPLRRTIRYIMFNNVAAQMPGHSLTNRTGSISCAKINNMNFHFSLFLWTKVAKMQQMR